MDIDALDMNAFRLYQLVQWGHDPEHVMKKISNQYRLFLFASVDAYIEQETASNRNKKPPRPSLQSIPNMS